MANIARINPIDTALDELMRGFFVRPMSFEPGNAAPQVRVDVTENENGYVVRAEVPGVNKSHLEVEASDVSLTIKGEMQEERQEEDERYRLHETSRGVFERTVRLPSDCDSTRAKATFKDGVLEVELPKVDRFKPHHVKF